MAFTQITGQVISANAVNSTLLANNSVLQRHILNGTISADKLAANVATAGAVGTSINSVQDNLSVVSSNLIQYAARANANIDLVQSNANSNDFVTLLSAYSNDAITLLTARGNDFTTLTVAYSNDGTTLGLAYSNDATTLLTARSNDFSTLLSAYSNDFTTITNAYANDASTLLTARSNDFTTLQSAYSNDFTTITAAYSNDTSTLLTARSNDYSTYLMVTGAFQAANSNIANLQVGISGSNTRIAGAESNIITLQSFASGERSNVANIINGTTPFTGNVTMQRSLTVQGNLIVVGSQVDLGVGSTTIYDAILTLNANLNSTTPPPADAGILINRGSEQNVFIGIEGADPHIHFIYTDSPGSNTSMAEIGHIDVHANAFHATLSSQTNPAFSIYNDQNTGLHFVQPDTLALVTGGVIQANVTSEGNLILTSGHLSSFNLKNFIDLETDRFSNSISLGSITNIALFLDTNNNGNDDFFGIYNDTNDMGQNVDSAILSVRNNGTLYSKGNLNFISSNATTDVYSGNSIISTRVFSSGVELRANDYVTYLMALGGLTGSNTNITNLQTGLTGSNTRLSGAESNVISLQGGLTGSNTRISGAESNVIALQGGLAGANTVNTNQTTGLNGANTNITNLQTGLSGSNTRITGAESNVIALQGGIAGSNANIYSTYLAATSNDFITYSRLNANLNAVSSNTDSKLSLSGGTMSGNIAMGSKNINNLADPVQLQDAATRNYVLSVTGTTLTPRWTTNISSGTSNVVAITVNSPVSIERISVSLSGVMQFPNSDFVFNSGNSSIQYTVASLPAGLSTLIQSWS